MKRCSTLVAAMLLVASAPAWAATNLITNGDFETGDLTGWTAFGGPGSVFLENGTSIDGAYSALFRPADTGGGIRQEFATAPRQALKINFLAEHTFSYVTGEVRFDDKLLFILPQVPGLVTPFSFDVVATQAISTLSFNVSADHLAYIALALDDVEVLAAQPGPVPEPATWAMMVAGFALAGAALRRRWGLVTCA